MKDLIRRIIARISRNAHKESVAQRSGNREPNGIRQPRPVKILTRTDLIYCHCSIKEVSTFGSRFKKNSADLIIFP
jgi:hypothetical protein